MSKHRIVEIKAKCKDAEKVRHVLLSQGADCKGTDHQVDTYFRVAHGRLKLREGNIENSLIFYQRQNTALPKQSDVILFASQPGSSLKEILRHALGVLTVVDKSREIYFIENVKFHIDIVEGLGNFVEIEAIDSDGSIGEQKLREQCHRYMALLNVDNYDLVSVSYSDLLLRATEG